MVAKKSEKTEKKTDAEVNSGSNIKRLLEVRKHIKGKKPTFKRQDSHKKTSLGIAWRRPTGLQSKMRHQFKGYSRRVKQGWRSPVEIRNFHGKGVESVLVFNIADLTNVKQSQGIIIAKTVGKKKRIEIIKKAQELKLMILNINADKFLDAIQKEKEQKDAEKKTKAEKKKKSLEENVKKAEDKKKEKKALEESQSESEQDQAEKDKKKEEKKEKDDVLIHNQ